MNQIRSVKYTKEYLGIWDSFVKNSRNGTFLNTKRFLNYHPQGKFEDLSLLFYKKNVLISVFPAALVKDKNDNNMLFSHPGSTYGGIIISNKTKLKHVDDIVKKLINFSISNVIEKIVIKLPPRIYYKYPSDEIDFILFKNNFKIRKRDLTTTIFFPNFRKNYNQLMDSSCKRAIKSAKNQGLTVQVSNDFDAYWKILTQNLKKHNTTPVHSITEIQLLKSLFPDKIQLFSAFLNGKMIGGTITFLTTTTIHTQYIAMLYEFQQFRPINAVFDFLIQYGISKGYIYLNFGVSTEEYGDKINWNLFDFKESFGARGILHELYELKINKCDKI